MSNSCESHPTWQPFFVNIKCTGSDWRKPSWTLYRGYSFPFTSPEPSSFCTNLFWRSVIPCQVTHVPCAATEHEHKSHGTDDKKCSDLGKMSIHWLFASFINEIIILTVGNQVLVFFINCFPFHIECRFINYHFMLCLDLTLLVV